MIDLSHLGELQEDGSILLFDENIKYRQAMTGHYRRVRQSAAQKSFLGGLGYTPVTSSFISAIMVDRENEDNLIIRFLNGSVYEYYGFADEYDRMLFANSKGQYFNRNIRPTKLYAKIGTLLFPEKIEIDIPQMKWSDDEMFDKLELDYLQKLLREQKGAKLKLKKKIINGVEFNQFDIGDITFYRPASR